MPTGGAGRARQKLHGEHRVNLTGRVSVATSERANNLADTLGISLSSLMALLFQHIDLDDDGHLRVGLDVETGTRGRSARQPPAPPGPPAQLPSGQEVLPGLEPARAV